MALILEENKELKNYSTFGIGGKAKYFITVKTIEDMQTAFKECRELNLPYFILGKGSNCLFDDRGFNGVVILNKIDFIEERHPGTFHVGAGYNFSLLGVQTARQGWSGLEFASGIPGSVGGAVFMNAGANTSETAGPLVSVDFVDFAGKCSTFQKNELVFAYRHSSFHHIPGAIVAATFALTPCPAARQKQIDLVNYRIKTQPYGEKSAGCVFRNPEGNFAGALIEKCGLKGFHVGEALISPMHANFIVNHQGASSKEVLELIDKVKMEVKEQTGYDLHMEVKYIPYREGS